MVPHMCGEGGIVCAFIGAVRTLVLLSTLHVDLHRVKLEVDLCVVVESTHPTDIPALESMLGITVVYQSCC